jgi:putative protease
VKKPLELLAPAKDAAHGIAAVDYGADAIYIGGPRFGARSAAGNEIDEIGRLAAYAHRFGIRVYLTLNTLLYDDELREAERIVRQAWEAGVDALIVQDMAFLEMDLPPIALHASTQTAIRTPGRAVFLERAGFSRLILERALSLDEIRTIRAATGAELEVFVHGAICVCYSGQCYLSQAIAGKSGNRGECRQPCRWDFSLRDGNGKTFATGKHLLSVSDLNLSNHLEALADAGATSFKIEGRLKDMTYLKNSVAFYRQQLDALIARRPEFSRASAGTAAFDFIPDPEKSFSRGFSDYFLNDTQNRVASFGTPKSVGKPIGRVARMLSDRIELETESPLIAGDGICFMTPAGLAGTNVNRAEGRIVWPNRKNDLTPGTVLFRNHDHAFVRALDTCRTRRTIGVTALLDTAPGQITLTLTDETGVAAKKSLTGDFDPPKNADKNRETWVAQLSKTGETPFRMERVDITGDLPFLSAAAINVLRRETLAALDDARLGAWHRPAPAPRDEAARYPAVALDYRANVTNVFAEKFFRNHGVTGPVEAGLERQKKYAGKELMRTRYCLRREMNLCPKERKGNAEKLYLENKNHTFELHFDCRACEMAVVYPEKKG